MPEQPFKIIVRPPTPEYTENYDLINWGRKPAVVIEDETESVSTAVWDAIVKTNNEGKGLPPEPEPSSGAAPAPSQ